MNNNDMKNNSYFTDGNPAIEKALEEWNEYGEEADLIPVFDAIVEGMKDELEVIVPVEILNGYIEDDDGCELTIRMVDGDDGTYMVAFTSTVEYEKGSESSTIPFVFTELIKIALDNEECQGIVINPWGYSISIKKAGLQNLLDAITPPTQDEIDLENGSNAYQNGDFETAVELYRKAASAGNITAISNLGYCYYYGRSIPVDKEKARECWTKAAIFGDICATYKLGDMYRNGDLPADEEFAKMLYRKAFFMANENPDIYSAPDVLLRILKYCSDELEPEALKRIADDCVKGLEQRIEDGDNFSKKLLEEAKSFQSMFD